MQANSIPMYALIQVRKFDGIKYGTIGILVTTISFNVVVTLCKNVVRAIIEAATSAANIAKFTVITLLITLMFDSAKVNIKFPIHARIGIIYFPFLKLLIRFESKLLL